LGTMDTNVGLTVGAVARLAGVSVRTMHHYDEIGLVSPSDRTEAGYRLYGQPEIERLQEVLFFRELGFSLDDIRRIMDAPGYRRGEALHKQREMLEVKANRILEMIEAINVAFEAERTGMTMSPEDVLEVFGDFDPSEHEDEARERWGDTDAYRESNRRVKSYAKQDWLQIQTESAAINEAFLALMAEGRAPRDEAAMDIAERHREHISRWFYECSPEIHAGLGHVYVADHRFTENIDKAGPGLAGFMSEAIAANARR
jgi:MerR family transcriptional regulator, thiopeptide resistance regulator